MILLLTQDLFASGEEAGPIAQATPLYIDRDHITLNRMFAPLPTAADSNKVCISVENLSLKHPAKSLSPALKWPIVTH